MAKRKPGEREILFNNGIVKISVEEKQGPSVFGPSGHREAGHWYDHYYISGADGSWSALLAGKEGALRAIASLQKGFGGEVVPASASEAKPLTAGTLRYMIRNVPDERTIGVDIASLVPNPAFGGRFALLTQFGAGDNNRQLRSEHAPEELSTTLFLGGAVRYWQVEVEGGECLDFLTPNYEDAAASARESGGRVVPYLGPDPDGVPMVLVRCCADDGRDHWPALMGKAYAEANGYEIISEDPKVVAEFVRENDAYDPWAGPRTEDYEDHEQAGEEIDLLLED
jgi:hypothetical protein